MDKQEQRSVKPNESVSHREWRPFCGLGREPHQYVCLFTRSPVSFERPHKYSLHVDTCYPTSAPYCLIPYCKDAVRDMLFCSYTPHIRPDNPVWHQSGYTDGNKRLLCVLTITKRVWQAEASSTERMLVSWARCSLVKLLRSFHRMAEPTSTGAKLKTNWKHGSAHGGQTSVNNQLHCSHLCQQWHCLLWPLYISLPLHLLFKQWRWLPDAPSPGQPSSFLPQRVSWGGQQKFPFVGVRREEFASNYIWNEAGLRFTEKQAPLNVERSGPTVCTEFGFHCCFHGWLLPIALQSCYWSQSTPHIIYSHCYWLTLLGCTGLFCYCACDKIMDVVIFNPVFPTALT